MELKSLLGLLLTLLLGATSSPIVVVEDPVAISSERQETLNITKLTETQKKDQSQEPFLPDVNPSAIEFPSINDDTTTDFKENKEPNETKDSKESQKSNETADFQESLNSSDNEVFQETDETKEKTKNKDKLSVENAEGEGRNQTDEIPKVASGIAETKGVPLARSGSPGLIIITEDNLSDTDLRQIINFKDAIISQSKEKLSENKQSYKISRPKAKEAIGNSLEDNLHTVDLSNDTTMDLNKVVIESKDVENENESGLSRANIVDGLNPFPSIDLNQFDSNPTIKKVASGHLLIPLEFNPKIDKDKNIITRLNPNHFDSRPTTIKKVAEKHRLIKINQTTENFNIITRLKPNHFDFREDVKTINQLRDSGIFDINQNSPDNNIIRVKEHADVSPDPVTFFDDFQNNLYQTIDDESISAPAIPNGFNEDTVALKDLDNFSAPKVESKIVTEDNFDSGLEGIEATNSKAVEGDMTCCSCAVSKESCASDPGASADLSGSSGFFQDIQNSFLNAVSPRFGGLGGLGGSPFGNCPKETPYPCFCYDTSTESVGGLGPGLEVVFEQDTASNKILLHLIRIEQPEIDFDVMQCVRNDQRIAATDPTAVFNNDQRIAATDPTAVFNNDHRIAATDPFFITTPQSVQSQFNCDHNEHHEHHKHHDHHEHHDHLGQTNHQLDPHHHQEDIQHQIDDDVNIPHHLDDLDKSRDPIDDPDNIDEEVNADNNDSRDRSTIYTLWEYKKNKLKETYNKVKQFFGA